MPEEPIENSSEMVSTSRDKPAGEPMVWLAGMGLAVGIFLTGALISLILWQGLKVFWPSTIYRLEVRQTNPEGDELPPLVLAGAVTKERESVGRAKALDQELDPIEWQVFTGNKELFGQAFRYLWREDVLLRQKAAGIHVAERLVNGALLFYPEALAFQDGRRFESTHEKFADLLQVQLREVRSRWNEIRRLERVDLVRLNERIQTLQSQLDETDRRQGEKAKQLEILENQYEELASHVRNLRQRQRQDQLEYRLISGEVRTESLGNLLRVHVPNEMNWLQRIAHFFAHLWRFLTEEPREANTEGGIFPAIFGTVVMTVLMSAAVMPFGVLAAIYLREYAHQGLFVRMVRISVNNLAGVPSIVFGVFGLGFFVYFLGGSIDALFYSDRPAAVFGTGGIFWAALTLALMTVPVVIVATEEALAAVPRGTREASLACGASKWQTIQRIILPAAAPGVLTGLILAMARGAGEVAPLMLVGVVKLAPELPIDTTPPFIHLERKFMHLGFHIYDLSFQSPDSDAAIPMVFATTLLLVLLVLVLNLAAILLRNHLRRKYAAGIF